ncbi:cytochrome c biogenesis CcdA family protein [Streptomyces sp. NPDC048518]|uniref:cytochrome c biogenesis CcdA family protein n=1 Tax=Streptomyces sp. NPDC048518 TaxID=3155029 RepID=UPI0033DE7A93
MPTLAAAISDPNQTVMGGALLLAIPVAVLGGLVSFFSPCVLPLVPGYLSYVTGVSGQDLGEARRGRMAAGATLFVAGFTVIFVSATVFFGALGRTLREHQSTVNMVLGVVMIVLGLFFMGLMPWLTQREYRFHKRPAVGLAGAPIVGALFAVGWTPCIGPTLASVLTLSADGANPQRGAILGVAYSLGLGIPFILAAVAFRKALGAFGWIKRHYAWVMRIGGVMMIATGLLLVTGVWDSVIQHMQVWSNSYTVGI